MRYFLIYYITHEQSLVDMNWYTQANCMKYKAKNFPTELVAHGEVKIHNKGTFLGITAITEVSEEDFIKYK